MPKNRAKIELIQWITSLENEELLSNMIRAKNELVFQEESKTMVIGYRPNNAPVIKSSFLKSIQQAEHQIENGECLSLENFEIEVENW